MSLLAACEKAWHYRYVLKDKRPPSDQMYFGTGFHAFADLWWDGASVDEALAQIDTSNMYADDVGRLRWLANRYDEMYRNDRDTGRVKIIGTNIKMTAMLGDVEVVGWFDFIALIDGLLYLGERKTMGDWRRLDTLDVDMQVSDYAWLAQQNGLPIAGIVYDAVRTYQWNPEKPTQKFVIAKAEAEGMTWPTNKARTEWARAEVERHPGVERPVYDSFQWLTLLRTPEQIEEAVLEMQTVLRRKAVLVEGERPMRNIGFSCKTCPFRERCYDEMAFPPVSLDLGEWDDVAG